MKKESQYSTKGSGHITFLSYVTWRNGVLLNVHLITLTFASYGHCYVNILVSILTDTCTFNFALRTFDVVSPIRFCALLFYKMYAVHMM